MKKICYIFLCILLCQIYANAYSQVNVLDKDTADWSSAKYPRQNISMERLFSLNAIDAVTIHKGSLFRAKCDSDIVSGNYKYKDINFVSINPDNGSKFPQKIVFRGEIVKNKAPHIGSSGEVKIKLKKIVVYDIAYPVKASIKMANNKKVVGGIIMGDSLYPQNVKNAANYGNSYMSKNTTNPCTEYCDTEHPIKTAFNLTKGALITTTSVVASPLIGLLGKGDNVHIKGMSDFVIKIDDDISVAIPKYDLATNDYSIY